ncbi:hypothetical protein HY224_02630 [Candidatus Uhrbacteria bacterium]|nr:hypothetical protein [Candidatus Uhrbacteria bacterium]
MTLLTVPLNKNLAQKIDEMIKHGYAANKADLARRALENYIEDRAVLNVLQAEQEVKEGKVFRGKLDDLAGKI